MTNETKQPTTTAAAANVVSNENDGLLTSRSSGNLQRDSSWLKVIISAGCIGVVALYSIMGNNNSQSSFSGVVEHQLRMKQQLEARVTGTGLPDVSLLSKHNHPSFRRKEFIAFLNNPQDPDNCIDNVCGLVTFTEPSRKDNKKYTKIYYSFGGLTPGKHGFHVHEFQITKGETCTSTGGHWNPKKVNHGSNLDEQRHVGDMGNIEANKEGIAEGTLLAEIKLSGRDGLKGRAVVIHAGIDDLGLGGNDPSRAAGNAGSRLACGDLNEV